MTAAGTTRSTSRLLPWVPLLVAALSSYGPVPWNYGLALYFLDYRHGFVKRGLVGELFSGAAFLSGAELRAAEYLCLATAFALTYVLFRRLLFGRADDAVVSVLLLSAPGALPHIGYIFGQPDVTLFLLLLCSLLLLLHAPPTVAAGATVPLCGVALLVHEAFLLMFYPLLVAILMQMCRKRLLSWQVVMLHVSIVLVTFVAVIHFGTLKVSPSTILMEAQARTNVGIQHQVYDVVASTFTEQRALVRRLYTPLIWKVMALTLLIAAPYFTLVISLLYRAMRAAALPAWQRVCTGILFLSPLLLCAVGHDFTRWSGATCIDCSFFVLYLFMTEEAAATWLRMWANRGQKLTWLGYLVAIGPLGATGIRSAEQLVSAWSAR